VVLHLRAQGLAEGDEHPPTLSCGAWLTLPFTFKLAGHVHCNGKARVLHTCILQAVVLSVGRNNVESAKKVSMNLCSNNDEFTQWVIKYFLATKLGTTQHGPWYHSLTLLNIGVNIIKI